MTAPRGREVVIALEARPGPWRIGSGYAPLDGWMYNRAVPGPLIEASIGDTLVVRLTNRLPEPTALHWSGLSNAELRCIEPDETREHRFALTEAGTFRYHADEAAQQERGLYGVLVVRAAGEPGAAAERVLAFDDVRVGPRGRIAANDGGAGNVLLLDGRVQPVLLMKSGVSERWRLVNAAHARRVRFSLGGMPFRAIGEESMATELPLAPGDCTDVLVEPPREGTCLHIGSLPQERGGRHRLADVFGTVRTAPLQDLSGRCGTPSGGGAPSGACRPRR